MSERLTNKGLTIKDVIRLSWQYYKSNNGDNKAWRSKIDIVNAKITARNNYEYNRTDRVWEQTGRDIKITFLCKSDPKSYKKKDSISKHIYPITFLIHDISKGINSTFRWRTGSLKKPIFKNPSLSALQISEKNIKNGVQLQFVYELEYILKKNDLLYGICYANRPPIKTNPKNKIFFDKHAFFIVANFLTPMLKTNGGAIVGKLIKQK
jgi:hypothetical protein